MQSSQCPGFQGYRLHFDAPSESLRRRIDDHPCYSEEAHCFFARIHLAVAPRCNVFCNYCNRKFDCPNESRPGVASKVLSPQEAVRQVELVLERVPWTTVVGIAGPGDPLANPQESLQTFRLVHREFPDLMLCLSTNGLALTDHLDELVELGVSHVTLTINMVDPEVGRSIYSWVRYGGIVYRGWEGAELLRIQQMRALEELRRRDILTKVNIVLIPEVNDFHLPEVVKEVQRRGAFLVNVIPLLLVPGSKFEKQEVREPSLEERRVIQDLCERKLGVQVMRHCRLCRADAAGFLGQQEEASPRPARTPQDRGAFLAEARRRRDRVRRVREEVLETLVVLDGRSLRVAVASRGGRLVNEHFGRTREFLIFEVTSGAIRLLEIRPVAGYCTGPQSCGDEPQSLSSLISLLSDCHMVLCSRIGLDPVKALRQAGIRPVEAYGFIDRAIAGAVGAHVKVPAGNYVTAGKEVDK